MSSEIRSVCEKNVEGGEYSAHKFCGGASKWFRFFFVQEARHDFAGALRACHFVVPFRNSLCYSEASAE